MKNLFKIISKILKVILIIIAIIIIGISLYFLTVKIFSNYILKEEKWHDHACVIQLLFPPKNYNAPLVKKKLDISKQGKEIEMQFINKYIGVYRFGFYLENIPDNLFFDKPDSDLKISFDFFANDKLYLSHVENFTEKKYSSFFAGNESFNSGYTFTNYRCLRDLPIKEVVTCKIKVLIPDKSLNDKVGDVMFFVEKSMDY